MEDKRPASSNERDAEFMAWLDGLGFSIDAEQLGAARQAFDQVAAMKQMNLTPPERGLREHDRHQ
jgi:hypothetical protein